MAEIGSTEAVRDWFNASFYNKEEIDNLFIQNNQQGLIPYDLTIIGDQPEQMIKLVGQTSGKTYNICLAALIGDNMINFSTEEQKTGIKWIDGKDVYQKTVVGDTAPTSGQTHITGVDELICSFGAQLYTGGSPLRWYDFPFTGNANGPRAEVDTTTHNLNVIWGSGATFTKYRWTFLYTKV